jgi:hypothetical protein
MGAALCKIQDPSKPDQLSYLANQNNEFGICFANKSKEKSPGYCVFNEKEAQEVIQASEKGTYTGGHVKCFASHDSSTKVSIADNISLADAQASKNASLYRLATPNVENIRKNAVENGKNPDEAVQYLDGTMMLFGTAINMACNGQDQVKCDKAKEEAIRTYNEMFIFNPLVKAQESTATATSTPTKTDTSSVTTPPPSAPVFAQPKSFFEEHKYLLIIGALCVVALIGLIVYSIVSSSTVVTPPQPARGVFFGGVKKIRFNPKLDLK